MTISLYQIAHEHRAMVDALMETQDDAAAIADTIEAESWALEVKAQNVAYAVKSLDALAGAIKHAEAEMSARRRRVEARSAAVRDYLKECMELAGVNKIDCPHFALSIRKNPASVDIFEEGLIPAEFMTQPEPPPRVPDRRAIKAAIDAGSDVPGAKLTQKTRVEIK